MEKKVKRNGERVVREEKRKRCKKICGGIGKSGGEILVRAADVDRVVAPRAAIPGCHQNRVSVYFFFFFCK